MFKRTWNTWNGATGVGRWLKTLGFGVAFAAALPGCMAHARGEVVYDYPVVTVEAAPARIETYPRTYYHGQPAYLVDGRWYYRSGPRWVYFRDEPVELRDYRVRHYDSPRYHEPRRGERYSDVVADRRAERYRDDRRAERYREQRLAAERAEHRRAEERRAEQHRAAERRAEQRRMEERRAAERRAEQRRMEEHRAAERRAAEHREAERRLEERRADQRRDERKGRVAEKRPRDDRRRARDRDRDRDDRDRRND